MLCQDMDVYAKLLYVRDMKAELAQLAHKFLETHKFTPEACCIIGHNYSIKSDHKKVEKQTCEGISRCVF